MATDVWDQMNFLQFRWYTRNLNHLKMLVYECSGDTVGYVYHDLC